MQGILRFDLPEEEEEFQLAQTGGSWRACLDRIKEQLRSWTKYGHEFQTADQALEATRDMVVEAEGEYELDGGDPLPQELHCLPELTQDMETRILTNGTDHKVQARRPALSWEDVKIWASDSPHGLLIPFCSHQEAAEFIEAEIARNTWVESEEPGGD